MLQEALRLAKYFRVLVCEPGGKLPIIPRGVNAATREPVIIKHWFEQCPDANVAIATGDDFFGLDIDAQHGGYGSLQLLEQRYGPLPLDTVIAKTPSGGMHFLYRYPKDRPVSNTASRVGRGLDTRGDGGYIVVDPSEIVTKDGEVKRYRWVYPPWEKEIADGPRWLIKLARRKPKPLPKSASGSSTANVNGIVHTLLRATEGERNSLTFWAACRFGEMIRAGRLDEAEAITRLCDAAERLGLSRDEAEATARSGIRTGMGS